MDAKNDNELMLALHYIFEAVQTQRKCNAASAQELLSEMVEIVAEERGAFLEEADA